MVREGEYPSTRRRSSADFIDNIPLRDQPVAIHATPGAAEIQQLLDRLKWVSQPANAVAYAPYLRRAPLPGHPTKRVLLQFARGDRSMTNPTTTALIRAGQLTDRTTLYRADLAVRARPHQLTFWPAGPGASAAATAVQRSIAMECRRSVASIPRRVPRVDIRLTSGRRKLSLDDGVAGDLTAAWAGGLLAKGPTGARSDKTAAPRACGPDRWRGLPLGDWRASVRQTGGPSRCPTR